MAISPARVDTDRAWVTPVAMVLAATTVAVASVVLVAQRIDDERQPRRAVVTTPRTTVAPATVSIPALSDLGGSIHHRSGNQP